MNKKDANAHAGFLAAAAIGLSHRPLKTRTACAFCHRPIAGGQGYKFLPRIGPVHGACFQERERAAQGEGKDAEQGHAQAPGDSSGVCPEG